MKILAVGNLLVYAFAFSTTQTDCLNSEEVELKGACRSIWYKYCDKFSLAPGTTCNFITQAGSEMQWQSDQVDVVVWNY